MEIVTQSNEKEQIPFYLNNARYVAIRLLSRHERSDSYIDKLLDIEHKNGELNQLDKALLNELVHGVTRWKGKLDWILTGFYKGDYQKCLNIVKNAMRVALYQIVFLNKIPVHAAVDESVEIIKRIQGEKIAAIVNGVLRNISRNLENVRYPDRNEDLIYHLAMVYSHPKWIVKRWLENFGEEETEKLLIANNQRPNLPLRINTIQTSVEKVYTYLKENNIEFYPSKYLEGSFEIKTPRSNIISTELFQKGFITVQDSSASLAALLSQAKPGMTIIDLCAAPGGKSFFIAEMINDNGKIYAIDKYKSKLKFIEDGIYRLGLKSIIPLSEDASTFKVNEPADIVFADVPCSGLGTLSKKPDIKWKREVEDIDKLVNLQREILKNAADLVKVNGALVYSTCTIEKEENEYNINWFLNQFPNFELDAAEKYLNPELCKNGFMKTLPHIHKMDGAFAARLIRKY